MTDPVPSGESPLEERTFPVFYSYAERKAEPSPVRRIPWSIAERAYMVYSGKYGTRQSMETLAARGGFSPGELDMFVPGWRDDVSEIVRLTAEVARLTAERDNARDDLRRECEASEHHRAEAARYREALEECEERCRVYNTTFGHVCEAMVQVRQIVARALLTTEGGDR